MRTADEILAYIDYRYSLYLERPVFYFGSPAEMEAVLFDLEQLYELTLGGEGRSHFGYIDFLADRGYGVGRFTSANADHPELFSEMADFWREYMASDRRKRPTDETTLQYISKIFGIESEDTTSTLIGHHRLACQIGQWVAYADIAVEITENTASSRAIHGLDTIYPPWRAGAIFGITLLDAYLPRTCGFDKASINITAFLGQPCDTSVIAVAYATFHAVLKALARKYPDIADISKTFHFDETNGHFTIGRQSCNERTIGEGG